MPKLLRYVLRHVPEWALIGVAALAVREWVGASYTTAFVVLGVWVLKDLLLYPALRNVERPPAPEAEERLVGLRGISQEPLRPTGYVLLRGELWRAEASAGEPSIPTGAPVQVRGVRGKTLLVSREGQKPARSRTSGDSSSTRAG